LLVGDLQQLCLKLGSATIFLIILFWSCPFLTRRNCTKTLKNKGEVVVIFKHGFKSRWDHHTELARSGGSSSEAHLRCCRRINTSSDCLPDLLARPWRLFIVISNLSGRIESTGILFFDAALRACRQFYLYSAITSSREQPAQ
jgi:hypothetical protein